MSKKAAAAATPAAGVATLACRRGNCIQRLSPVSPIMSFQLSTRIATPHEPSQFPCETAMPWLSYETPLNAS